MPGCDGTGTDEKSYPSPRSGAAAEKSYSTSKVRGSGREELPHTQEKEMQKAKWLPEEALQIAVKRREAKSKGEKERYKHLNAGSIPGL